MFGHLSIVKTWVRETPKRLAEKRLTSTRFPAVCVQDVKRSQSPRVVLPGACRRSRLSVDDLLSGLGPDSNRGAKGEGGFYSQVIMKSCLLPFVCVLDLSLPLP